MEYMNAAHIDTFLASVQPCLLSVRMSMGKVLPKKRLPVDPMYSARVAFPPLFGSRSRKHPIR